MVAKMSFCLSQLDYDCKTHKRFDKNNMIIVAIFSLCVFYYIMLLRMQQT